ncbi:MAG: hypothetical protein WDM77_02180 [Steroidobacteraceae bacterium]
MKESFQGAIEKLIGALENKSEQVPLLRHRYASGSRAHRRAGMAILPNRLEPGGDIPGSHAERGSARTHWISKLAWPEDIRPVFSIGHAETYPRPSDIFRACIEHVHPSLGEHVFLLFTPNKLKEMLPTQLTGLYINERALIHVIADAHTRVQKRVPSGHPGEESLGHADTNSTPDGPTLTWRQWFMGNVKCLTAPQIAAGKAVIRQKTPLLQPPVEQRREDFRLRQAGQILYPAFQFKHGAPLPTIAPILQALGSDPTGWTMLSSFPHPMPILAARNH